MTGSAAGLKTFKVDASLEGSDFPLPSDLKGYYNDD